VRFIRHCHRATARKRFVNVHTPRDIAASLVSLKANRRNTMGMLNKATARVHGVLDQAVDAAAPAAQWMEEHGEELAADGRKLAARTRKYVIANPLQALGLALATGYLISRIVR
jgi:ElaB/YqjD/DUF883 family membrane-anchored ribosome-binding protein